MTADEKKIQDQAMRIRELEGELEELKKELKQGLIDLKKAAVSISEVERLLYGDREIPESISPLLRWRLMREKND